MRILASILITLFIVSCGTMPMPPDKTKGDLNLNMELGKLNYIDIDQEPTFEENQKIYGLDQESKNTIKQTIGNNINKKGDKYNITIIINEAKVKIIKDEIASKTIQITSEITLELLTNEGESNFKSEASYVTTINTPNFKWEIIDVAYRRALSNSVHKALKTVGEKL